ncbi:MAG: LysR family transcriptional regulator [Gemmatimonadaceae bacterium]
MTDALQRLNFHHLHYFWAVAKDGNLTRTAERLRVAQSALSKQIRQLETQLEQPLFVREGRRLVLTEAGRIAMEYADTIMAAGSELMTTLRDGKRQERQLLRIGAVATLSRNFQRMFLAPLFKAPDVSLLLHSGAPSDLLSRLRAHSLDVVLSNRRVLEEAQHAWRCMRIARQEVILIGHRRRRPFRFPIDLEGAALVLPTRENELRSGFDLICEQHGVRPIVVAEVDDMAMLRLMARELNAIALAPAVVVRDELKSGRLHEYCVVPNLHEEFYAITVRRRFKHPLLRTLLERPSNEILDESE